MHALRMNLSTLSRRLVSINFYSHHSNPHFAPRPGAVEQINYMKSIIESRAQDWAVVKNNILRYQGNINEKNLDASLLKLMVNSENYDCAFSYVKYLKSTNQELPLGAINGIFYLYIEYAKKKQLSDSEKQFILKSYDNLYEKYKVLDIVTCEKLLLALCAINEWEKAMKVLNNIYLSGIASHAVYSNLIATLFRNNRKSEALKMIQESLNNKRPLKDIAYEEWIKYVFRKYSNDKQKVLKYLNEICMYTINNYTILPMNAAGKLIDSYHSMNWNGEYTRIDKKSGHCVNCQEKLKCLSLSEDEFHLLQKNVKEKLIVGSDLFLKTSPEELKRFLTFVEQTAPYDVVLDALNIAYVGSRGGQLDKLKILNAVVDYFTRRKKRILLLGRKHMLSWRKQPLQQLMDKTCSFFTDNLTQDDPYFITAAVLSGSHTDFVSKDLLRGHKFNLKNDDLKSIFQRWQWQHQWMVFENNGRPAIKAPLRYTPCAQKSTDGWHIPYHNENGISDSQINEANPDSWICLRPRKDR